MPTPANGPNHPRLKLLDSIAAIVFVAVLGGWAYSKTFGGQFAVGFIAAGTFESLLALVIIRTRSYWFGKAGT